MFYFQTNKVNNNFSHNLFKDSGSLAQLLKMNFEQETIEELAEVYRLCSNSASNNESPVIREDGVSYNPRSARVLEILIKDAKCRSKNTLIKALSVGAESNELRDSKNITEALKEPDLFKTLEENEQSVFVAYLLDLVRHLHMTKLLEEKKLRILRKSEEIHKQYSTVSNSTLTAKLLNAINYQTKKLDNAPLLDSDI